MGRHRGFCRRGGRATPGSPRAGRTLREVDGVRWTQWAGKELIDITNARRLGSVADADLVFDPHTGRILELRLWPRPRSWWLRRPRAVVVPWSAIRRVGDDLVLVDMPDEGGGVRPRQALPATGGGPHGVRVAGAAYHWAPFNARKEVVRLPKTVVGSFPNRQQAEAAVEGLKKRGVREEDISVVTRDERNRGEARDASLTNQSLSEGTAWGAGIGAGAGLLASAGALAIPGIGPLLAAGPLAATLSGAAAGGLAGGLMDWGIPEQDARDFEAKVKQGRTLCAVRAEDDQVDAVALVLRDHGAHDVKTHPVRR